MHEKFINMRDHIWVSKFLPYGQHFISICWSLTGLYERVWLKRVSLTWQLQQKQFGNHKDNLNTDGVLEDSNESCLTQENVTKKLTLF